MAGLATKAEDVQMLDLAKEIEIAASMGLYTSRCWNRWGALSVSAERARWIDATEILLPRDGTAQR
jgi:hypothetical protein